MFTAQYKATPNGCLVSGPVDFQIVMRVGDNCHFIIMALSDKMIKTFAYFPGLLLHFSILTCLWNGLTVLILYCSHFMCMGISKPKSVL